jgi:hypothetical protein
MRPINQLNLTHALPPSERAARTARRLLKPALPPKPTPNPKNLSSRPKAHSAAAERPASPLPRLFPDGHRD